MTPASPRTSVLVVEDDPMVLATLRMALEAEKHEVTACTSPLDALKFLPDSDFAVIISDHKMPGMLGLDFLVECRRQRPNASRILLTSVLNLNTVVDSINRGEICRFIAKPWLKAELIAAVRDAAERHDLAVRNERLQAEMARLNERLTAANRTLEDRIRRLEEFAGEALGSRN